MGFRPCGFGAAGRSAKNPRNNCKLLDCQNDLPSRAVNLKEHIFNAVYTNFEVTDHHDNSSQLEFSRLSSLRTQSLLSAFNVKLSICFYLIT